MNLFDLFESNRKDVEEGHRIVPGINRERYTDLSHEGLEGPFSLKSGKVVYYDPKVGKYYDRDSDMYMSHEDYAAHELDEKSNKLGFKLGTNLVNKRQAHALTNSFKKNKFNFEEDNVEKPQKRLGPDMNDPYEQGWYAGYNDFNPYERGTSEHTRWAEGQAEREAQPNHYDESVEEGKTGPGLWANIHAKQNRIKHGSKERMRKPGSKGAPTNADLKASKSEGMAEATGDPKFDKMLKGITGKKVVAKQQKADTKQQARDAFGSMFGGENPAAALSIRKKGMEESWSQKYKSSINCSHPKGFSQKAHCAGKKKHNESVEMEMTCEDCGMCKTHGSLNEIKKGQKDSNGFTKCWSGYHAAGTKKSNTTGKSVRNCVPNESVSEGERTMSRAAKGNEKYGKDGMKALAKAGREGKSLDKVRDKYNKYDESVAEGAKVDRMVKHIASSEKKAGKSAKDAESIAWATANKRGMLDNKNKKKHVEKGDMTSAEHHSSGAKFGGYYKGTQKGAPRPGQSFGPMEESISLNTTVKAIANDIGEPITSLYATLKKMAKQYYDNNGDLKRFGLVAAGVGSRWFQTYYVNKMQTDLYDLTRQSPTHAAELKQFLRGKMVKDNLVMPNSFSELNKELPGILARMGRKMGAEALANNAKLWAHNKQDYENFIDKLLNGKSDDNEQDHDEPVDTPSKNALLGKQRNHAEEIVNDVLRKLPSSVAGDIRNAIARSPNKLQALQQELQRRKIAAPMEEGIAGNMTVRSDPLTKLKQPENLKMKKPDPFKGMTNHNNLASAKARNLVAKGAQSAGPGTGSHKNKALDVKKGLTRNLKHKGKIDFAESSNFLSWAVSSGYNVITNPAVYENAKRVYNRLLTESKNDLQPGQYYIWTVHFADGDTSRIKIKDEKFDVKAYYKQQNKSVINVDYNWEPHNG